MEWTVHRRGQISRQLGPSLMSAAMELEVLWEHQGEGFQYIKGLWEDFPEEIKAALGPKFVKKLDEIIEKVTKLFFKKMMRYFEVFLQK